MYADTDPAWEAPAVSSTGSITALHMTADEKAEVEKAERRRRKGKRPPFGFGVRKEA